MFRTPRLSALAQNSSVLVCRNSSWQREAIDDDGSLLATLEPYRRQPLGMRAT